ncbi:hypothetical protein ABZT51_46175 [Streptomyces sp. NPDC005373]|uniref:hypothetical protein n=1 Tax=unclassified Streptomyces TaxID=2593676 RepID=UPI0033A889A9
MWTNDVIILRLPVRLRIVGEEGSTPGAGPEQLLCDDGVLWGIAPRCACRKVHPRSSGGMPVFVEGSAKAVSSAYVEVGDLRRVERLGDDTAGAD